SKPILTGARRILGRWRPRELPIIQLAPVMTDDDCDFWGDMIYLRSLLDDINKRCDLDARIAPLDPVMSTKLDVALDLLTNPIYDWTIPAPAVVTA
ncbi:hypothetical protein, partial [Mycobacterium avium]